MNDRTHTRKVLTLVTTGMRRPNREQERAGLSPRASLFEDTLHSDILHEDSIRHAPFPFSLLYKLLPTVVAEVIEAYRIRKRYDVIVSWSDPHALLLALLMKVTRSHTPHVAMLAWISKPKKALLLKMVHCHITTIVLWTSLHAEFAIDRLRIPRSKIRLLPYAVDQEFYRPIEQECDMICSAGVEMRDYPTLVEAIRGLNLRCHIAAGVSRGKLFDTIRTLNSIRDLPDNLTIGALSSLEVRNLYARSRFIVVPLLPSDSDNGLTVILEAMAMGKAVICSRTRGQRDVIVDGLTGLYVPQGDPEALRNAIMHLWNNPEIAGQMGIAGRQRIEEVFTWDRFVRSIDEIVRDAALHPDGQRQTSLKLEYTT